MSKSRQHDASRSNRSPTNVDRQVGRNIRLYRNECGMTLADLAGEIGVSQQQVQKYESGVSRVSASTLVALAEVLNVPIQDLFAGARSKQPTKPTKMERARMECRALVERTRSLPKLKSMAKVLKAMSGD